MKHQQLSKPAAASAWTSFTALALLGPIWSFYAFLRWVLVPLLRMQRLGRFGLRAAFLTPFALCPWPFALLAAEPPTYYVNVANPTPAAPYTSWETAATNIQQAIDVGRERGRLVLVTNGLYRTGSVETNGLNRIALPTGVTVRSVNGPEVTVIEGVPGPNSGWGDIRCAYVGTKAVLSGFTLTNGHALLGFGSGAYCETSAMLTNCVLTGNSAWVGGGAYGGTLHNCTVAGNSAWDGGGGARLSTLQNCAVTGNSAQQGGGLYGGALHNCTLTGNRANSVGGGASGAALYNCTLTGNSASGGGGAYGGTLHNCTLTGNWADGLGGGVSGGTLYNCLAYFNTVRGVPDNHRNATFEYSCTTPLPSGPGNIDADPRLASGTHLSADSPCIGAGSAQYASGVDIDGETWGSPPCMGADQLTPGQATGPLTMRIEASHTSVLPGFTVQFVAQNQGRILSSVWDFGDGTVVTNQAFARHAWSQTGIYTVRLTGYNDSFPEGVTAVVDVRVTAGTYYVNANNPTPSAPYTSWETAATDIQDAIDAGAEPNRLVLVTNGLYRTGTVATNGLNRVALPENVTVRSVNGPEMTVIEGAPAPGGGRGNGAIRCAYLGTNAVLSGFTVTNGFTRADDGGWEQIVGGGALCAASAVLTNCVLTSSSAFYGGGTYGGLLYRCTLTNNTGNGGGAARSILNNCTVIRNSGSQGGGAHGCTLDNCEVTANSAYEAGGAYDSTLDNCTVTGNSARSTGGGVGQCGLRNCTLTGNSAGESGGGVSGGTLYNCLVYFNKAPKGANYAPPPDPSIGSLSTFEYCCTTPRPDGPGNIEADPRLASATHLSADSPCIAAGSKAYASGTDIDGEPWADPPCIGADQLVPGQAIGPLTMRIEANDTNVNVGYPVSFVALSRGPISASVWDFGDGVVVTNQACVRHAWSAPGIHTVRLTGYNDGEPAGVSTTLEIHVVDATYYVNVANSTPEYPYTSWATAATNIQQAIDAGTLPGRLVVVTNGVYRTGSVETNGLNRVALWDPVLVRSVNGPALTVIEGSRNNPETGEGEDVRCAYVGLDSVLSGFTLTKGYGSWYDGSTWLGGGGAWCAFSGVLTNCVLTGNGASDGGGVCGGVLYNCTLSGNLAGRYGGGAQSSTLYNCIVSGNSAGVGGGVSECTLHGCVLTRNSATGISGWGWGLCVGGGAYGGSLHNCTVTGNSSNGSGGGVAGVYSDAVWHPREPAKLYNCIVYFNQAVEGSAVLGLAEQGPNCSNCTVEYSCTTPLPGGPGNIDKDPQLATVSHLSHASPCIGAGSAAYATGTDIDGEPWANPPCMGADQVVPGHAVGALTMRIEATYTNVGVGYPVRFVADNLGPILSSVWDFGDGTAVTNEAFVRLAWSAPGVYTVRLTGYNDSEPMGVSATLEVQVVEVVGYVNADNPTPQFPHTSWDTAATNIQEAIDASAFPRQVVVTNGVYRTGWMETNYVYNRVVLTGPVLVRSVNGPGETIVEGSARDPQTGQGEDIRCAYVGAEGILSGFTLRGGGAGNGGGGGALCEYSGELTNCVVTGNSGGWLGGGVCGGTLHHCILTGNVVENYGGGAAYATLHNCVLTGNSASQFGGGAYWCALYDCTLSGNSASQSGGGAAHATLHDCTLTSNTVTGWDAKGGGAAECTLYDCTLTSNTVTGWDAKGGGAAECTLYNCLLTGNSVTTGYGGGSYRGTLHNCKLTGNRAEGSGGGVWGGLLKSCTLSGNSASGGGGASGEPMGDPMDQCILYNCTITRNSADSVGGVSGAMLYNCIVYFNTAPFGHNHNYSTFEFSCTSPLPPGVGNIDVDPELASVTHLSATSPCLGSGSAAYASGTDIDGEPWADPPCMGADQLVPGQATGPLTMRIEATYTNVIPGFAVDFVADNRGSILSSVWDFGDGTVVTNRAFVRHAWNVPGTYTVRLTGYNDSDELGALATLQVEVAEFNYYVNVANTTSAFPFTTWETAATNIQQALEAGTEGGRSVWVADGVYDTGSTQSEGLNRVALLAPVVVRSVNGPTTTIIDGRSEVRGVYVGDGAVLSGFTLTNGTTGASCEASAVLTNCVLTGNRGDGARGGTLYNCNLIGNQGSGAVDSTLHNCTLVGNTGGGNSGGALNSTLYNCSLIGNRGSGAVNSTLHNCTLTGNQSSGAVKSTLYNCSLTGNATGGDGGGAREGTLYNCTLTGNAAGSRGGGVSYSTLYNCIVYYNSARFGGANYHDSVLNYCCATPLPSGPGNLDLDPQLASAVCLGATSPCRGAGNVAYTTGTDLDGEPWAVPPSIGCDEPYPDGVDGSLSVGLQVQYAEVAVGYPVSLTALIEGRASMSVWDFGDGLTATNQPYTTHAWTMAGDFEIVLRASNQSHLEGITATAAVRVVQDMHYVAPDSPNPTPPYASWATAARTIQDAVDAAAQGGFVLVTNGTYATGGRVVNGLLTNRVAVDKPLRLASVNGPAFTTIRGAKASGGGGGSNAVRCVYLADGAMLSGFTLADGATGEWTGRSDDSDGAGAWCASTRAVLTNCVLTGNSAGSAGGGAYGGTLHSCVLSGNSAGYGGGAYSSTLDHCTLSGNSAGYGGGASESTLRDCVLTGNSASSGGGVSFGMLYNCTLTGNSASDGGGSHGGVLEHCALTGNSASQWGGGAYGGTLRDCTISANVANEGGGAFGAARLYNCILTGNSAQRGGGAAGTTMRNCVLTGNSAQQSGGGVSGGILYNCTLTRNSASAGGGVSGGTLYNCVVYFNTAVEGGNYGANVTFDHSCTTPLPPGPGNIDADPQFASGTHLSAGSPCIGAGSAEYATGTDLDGEPWATPPCIGADQLVPGQATGGLTMRIEATYTNVVTGFVVDFVAHNQGPILTSVWDFGDGTVLTNQPWVRHAWSAPGVYGVRLAGYNDDQPSGVFATLELQVAEAEQYFVNLANPTPRAPYTTWAIAATNIQQAIDAGTQAGRLVLVADGVYRSGGVFKVGWNRIVLGRAVRVRSVNGPGVTLIEGVASAGGGNGSGAARCAYVGADTVLSGFTLTNGHTHSEWYRQGGGAWCEPSGVLTNCVLAGNSAAELGGGAYGGTLHNCTLIGNWAGSGDGSHGSTNSAGCGGGAYGSTLRDCVLTRNSAAYGGGASESTLHNCTLIGNWAGSGGGAHGSTLQDCVLTRNSASWDGGGALGSTLNSCILSLNSANYGGGALHCTLNHCTLTGNSAGTEGGGVGGGLIGTLYNCIVCFNTAPNGPNYASVVEHVVFDHSCTTPLPPGTGNIDADPRFVDAAAGDFRLRPDSPCIDAGTNLVDLITTDIEGHPRPLDGNGDGVARFDMGAYEFDPGPPLSLTVALTPTGLRLEWPATALGSKLQRTASLSQPLWQDVPGSETATTLTLPVAQAAEFYRLVKP